MVSSLMKVALLMYTALKCSYYRSPHFSYGQIALLIVEPAINVPGPQSLLTGYMLMYSLTMYSGGALNRFPSVKSWL